jgi:hypothetical protein
MSCRALHPSNPSRSNCGSRMTSRHTWAWLLARVFAVEVMTCSRCVGRMRLVEIANSREDIARVLANVGLGPRPPPRPRPALPGQLELDLAVWIHRRLLVLMQHHGRRHDEPLDRQPRVDRGRLQHDLRVDHRARARDLVDRLPRLFDGPARALSQLRIWRDLEPARRPRVQHPGPGDRECAHLPGDWLGLQRRSFPGLGPEPERRQPDHVRQDRVRHQHAGQLQHQLDQRRLLSISRFRPAIETLATPASSRSRRSAAAARSCGCSRPRAWP